MKSATLDEELIWHYTSANALKAIVEKKELWLTDWRYMNDRTEVGFGIRIVSALARQELARRTEIQKTDHSYILKWLNLESVDIHFASFSEAGDSLEQ